MRLESAANWWLRSPNCNNSNNALYVNSNGDWNGGSCSYSSGIRPALKVPSILFEDSEAGLDLSKIPTDELLQEIHRRLAEKA